MTNVAGQAWDAEQYARHARFVSDLGWPVIELLDPRPGERILDLGCGDGELSHKLVELGCEVVGVDASAGMIDAARARGVDARVADAQDLRFDGEFDAVFSNAALHWMKDPDPVIAGVCKSLRPGGRFVAELGGEGNVAAIVAALEAAGRRRGLDVGALNPWYFPSADAYRARLEAQGFAVRSIALFPRPTPLPGDMVEWLGTFARRYTDAMPAGERKPFLNEVAERCAPRLRDPQGRWIADYVRLRFSAIRR